MGWDAKVVECKGWLATVDNVKTTLLSLDEDIFIPEISFKGLIIV